MKEKEINEFLALKLEEGKTHIYVNGKKFRQCKRLVINVLKQSIPIYDNIDSIDEAADLHQKYLYQNKIVEGPNARVLRDEIHDITPEQEFWGHCSNLQAWYEHNYDTRLIHSNLAFPLLKALVDAGDPDAKRVFKTEVAERFESGHPNAITSIFAARFLDYFSPEEKKQLLQHNVPAILIYIEKITKYYPNVFLVILEERLIDYLNPEQKTQLIQLNYPLILKCVKKMSKSRYYPKKALDSFKDLLFDHLNAEEITRVIQVSFPVILKDVEKIGKHYPHLFLYFFEEKLLLFLSREEQRHMIVKNYTIFLKYIRETSQQYPDQFFYLVNAGILDFLSQETKSRLIQKNHLVILHNLHKILNPEFADQFTFLYPNSLVVLFEERLLEYLHSEEKTQLILQNFPVLIIYVKRMTRDYADEFLMKMRSMERKRIPAKTLHYTYLTVAKAIQGTELMDDFFYAILDSAYRFDEISSILLKVIDTIKKQEQNQGESIEDAKNKNLNDVSKPKWIDIFTNFMNIWKVKRDQEMLDRNNPRLRTYNISTLPNINCEKCDDFLHPKSLLILLKKERAYCPNCGKLVQKKINPKLRAAYLEEVEKYLKEKNAPIIRFFDKRRSRCPMCGIVGHDSKKIEIKSKVLHFASIVPRQELKYVCKECGYEKII